MSENIFSAAATFQIVLVTEACAFDDASPFARV